MSTPYYIIAETETGETIKIPFSQFKNQFVNYIQDTPDTPSSDLEKSEQGMLTVEGCDPGFIDDGGLQSGLYIFSNNLWRKVPTYTYYWEDLEATDDSYIRFLPVHKEISLTDKQKEILQKNLQLTPANIGNPGIVRIKDISDGQDDGNCYVQANTEGEIYVNTASTTLPGATYIKNVPTGEVDENNNPIYTSASSTVYDINAIDFLIRSSKDVPIATTETLGGIRIGGDISNVDNNGHAYISTANVQDTPNYGKMRYAPSDYMDNYSSDSSYVWTEEGISQENSASFSVAQIKEFVQFKLDNFTDIGIPQASETTSGTIKTAAPIYTENNVLKINLAYAVDSDDYQNAGLVIVTNTMPDDVNKPYILPTATAIRNYVASQSGSNLPVATESTLGGIIVGANLSITSDGVLSGNIPTATTASLGTVIITGEITSNDTRVPTSHAVYSYVKNEIASIPETIIEETPKATNSQPGTVVVNTKSGESTTVKGAYLVPTVLSMRDEINNIKIPTIYNASPSQKGVVYISAGTSESTPNDGVYSVTTIAKVNELISSYVGGTSTDPTTGGSFHWILIGTPDLEASTILNQDSSLLSIINNTTRADVWKEGTQLLTFSASKTASDIQSILQSIASGGAPAHYAIVPAAGVVFTS